MTKLYPLTFKPSYKNYLWGGDKLISKYHRDEPEGTYAESWEVADRPENNSVVASGSLAGKTLNELCTTYGQDLLGTACPTPHFPLLIKLIDAKQPLSVQVHPSADNAEQLAGEAKTEMWYILDTEKDAAVYADVKPGVTKEQVEQAITDNTIEPLLNHLPVKTGDVIFIPGGRIHSIDTGCLIFEVQQNSDTTYRLYDWGRVGTDGQPRELHIEKALQAINWTPDSFSRVSPRLLDDSDVCYAQRLIETDYFLLNKCHLKQSTMINAHPNSFRVFFVESGAVKMECDDTTLELKAGQTVLMPACAPSYRLTPITDTVDLIAVLLP